MRPFTSFDPAAPPDRVREGQAAALRSAAALTWLALVPGFAFVRQRSNFILGWEAAAASGAALSRGESAGAVGESGVPALGSWMMLPDLTTPATRTVLPMNDALYGASHVELDRQGPVVVSIPADHTGRYFSVTVVDAHFTNLLHLGPRWSGREAVRVLLVPPGWQGSPPAGMPVFESPTASVCLLSRVLVTYASDDLTYVREWRRGFRITRLSGEDGDVPHDDLIHPDANVLADPWRYFRIGFQHLTRNPLPQPARWALRLTEPDLARAETEQWSRAAVEAGVADAQAMVDAVLTTWPRHQGWMVPAPWVGLPTDHVLENAALTLFQIGSNASAEAVYFFGDTDVSGEPLDGAAGAVYELRFAADALPPVHDDGFWSLTMYGADNLLVENPLERYSTRPTRPGFHADEHGAAVITLSAELPAGVDEAVWLPAPAKAFRLGLRLYYPETSAVDGRWRPPAPVRVR